MLDAEHQDSLVVYGADALDLGVVLLPHLVELLEQANRGISSLGHGGRGLFGRLLEHAGGVEEPPRRLRHANFVESLNRLSNELEIVVGFRESDRLERGAQIPPPLQADYSALPDRPGVGFVLSELLLACSAASWKVTLATTVSPASNSSCRSLAVHSNSRSAARASQDLLAVLGEALGPRPPAG